MTNRLGASSARVKRQPARRGPTKVADSKRLTARQRAELSALANLSDASIDTRDIPEATDWSEGVRGRFYRPIKQQLTLRLDADVIAWFKANDSRGYQTRINRALREYVASRSRTGRTKKNRGTVRHSS